MDTKKSTGKPLSPAAYSPLDRIARMLQEERDLARSQMADKLRAQFSHCERVSRMTLMLAIEKAEQAEANTCICGDSPQHAELFGTTQEATQDGNV